MTESARISLDPHTRVSLYSQMLRVRIHIRAIMLVLLAVMIPALGFAAHQHHDHPEADLHPREMTHSHHHGDAHDDHEAEHDHLPVKIFLDLVAAPGGRAVSDCGIAPLSANDHDQNALYSRGISAASTVVIVDYTDPPPLSQYRTAALRVAANLSPPSVS